MSNTTAVVAAVPTPRETRMMARRARETEIVSTMPMKKLKLRGGGSMDPASLVIKSTKPPVSYAEEIEDVVYHVCLEIDKDPKKWTESSIAHRLFRRHYANTNYNYPAKPGTMRPKFIECLAAYFNKPELTSWLRTMTSSKLILRPFGCPVAIAAYMGNVTYNAIHCPSDFNVKYPICIYLTDAESSRLSLKQFLEEDRPQPEDEPPFGQIANKPNYEFRYHAYAMSRREQYVKAWRRVVVLLAFMRANQDNAIRYSILPLVQNITSLL